MRTGSTLFALAAGLLIGVGKVFLLVVFLAPLSSFAQVSGTATGSIAGVIEADKLPLVLEGWIDEVGYGRVASGWRVIVEEIRPDGVIRGRMTFTGMNCVANNAPFDGTFDGTNIKLNMPFDQRNPWCRDLVYRLAWNESSNRFESREQRMSKFGGMVVVIFTLVPAPK